MTSDKQTPEQEHLSRHSSLASVAKIIECPRDAWQGLAGFIPTEVKAAYLARLLEAGFRHIDAVSFVSPSHVPQMADSEAVMQALVTKQKAHVEVSEIIGIVVNQKGFQRALATEGVTTIGYPHSISESFLRRNSNLTELQSRQIVEQMQAQLSGAKIISSTMMPNVEDIGLAVYISMAFGNPYGDPWSPELVAEALKWLQGIGVSVVSLADTVGKASPKEVGELFQAVKEFTAEMEIGVHLHSRAEHAKDKVLAAWEAGCRRFDGALTGLGGCPFAGDDLVGNIPTEIVVSTLAERGVSVGIELGSLAEVLRETKKLRSQYAH